MSRTWERIAPPIEVQKPILDAVLRPHRSLTPRAFKLMLAVVIGFNLIVAGFFVAQGAFPVAGFLGLDVLALWLAFRINYRAAQVEERIWVEREQVVVERRDQRGGSMFWRVNPFWVSVDTERGVLIRAGGRALRVGAFLPPKQQAAFAGELKNALWRARRGP